MLRHCVNSRIVFALLRLRSSWTPDINIGDQLALITGNPSASQAQSIDGVYFSKHWI